jgi:hypothetical protein
VVQNYGETSYKANVDEFKLKDPEIAQTTSFHNFYITKLLGDVGNDIIRIVNGFCVVTGTM